MFALYAIREKRNLSPNLSLMSGTSTKILNHILCGLALQ